VPGGGVAQVLLVPAVEKVKAEGGRADRRTIIVRALEEAVAAVATTPVSRARSSSTK